MTEPLLELRDLRLDIDTFDGRLQVLDGIGFRLARGETLGLVGETGCGKSVTAKSILRLLPSPPARLRGDIDFQGQNLLTLDAGRLRELRGRRIAMVFQDPMTYLNPVFSVGRQLLDVIAANYRVNGAMVSRSEARQRALQLLAQVQLPNPERQLRAYPHQLSGGMRQRVMIAMALSCRAGAADRRRRADHRTGRDHPGADPAILFRRTTSTRLESHFGAAVHHPQPRRGSRAVPTGSLVMYCRHGWSRKGRWPSGCSAAPQSPLHRRAVGYSLPQVDRGWSGERRPLSGHTG